MARILVVDHDIAACNAMAGLLRKLPYTVDGAYSGAAAIDRLGITGADLVILNLSTSRLDGWQVLQWARSHPIRARLPIIAYSDMSAELWKLARQQGASEHWPRGSQSFAAISESLERHLRNDRLIA